jgi:hypothetical protein
MWQRIPEPAARRGEELSPLSYAGSTATLWDKRVYLIGGRNG